MKVNVPTNSKVWLSIEMDGRSKHPGHVPFSPNQEGSLIIDQGEQLEYWLEYYLELKAT